MNRSDSRTLISFCYLEEFPYVIIKKTALIVLLAVGCVPQAQSFDGYGYGKALEQAVLTVVVASAVTAGLTCGLIGFLIGRKTSSAQLQQPQEDNNQMNTSNSHQN